MTSPLLELFRHKAWATLKLIEFCQTLDAEHLDATLPGTYGSVRATLVHLVNADHGYYRSLTGEQLGPAFDKDAGLETLAECFRALAPRWQMLLDDPALPDRDIQR